MSTSTKYDTDCLWNGHLLHRKDCKGKKKARRYVPFALYGEKRWHF
jgi:hypothetical protein